MAGADRPGSAVVELIVTRAGGGHLRAAAALAELARRQGRSWEIRQTDILELLAPFDPMRRFGQPSHAIYNWMLRAGATWLAPAMIRATRRMVRRHFGSGVELLERHWRAARPDLVVSLVPYVNPGLRLSLARARPGTPLATVMLDLADTPPDFWIDPAAELLVCPTDRAVEQALQLGLARNRIRRTSGMVVHPSFYDPGPPDRGAARASRGLDPTRPTGVVMFGGHGSRTMLQIARQVERSALDVQLIYLCGHNHALAAALEAMPRRRPRLVRGFTDRVHDYLALGDFAVGKPGPNSLAEALVAGLPVIVDLSWRTLVQERYNAVWVEEHGVGIVVGGFGEIEAAITRLIEPAALDRYRAAVAAHENHAVFEVVEILAQVLASRAARRAATAGRAG